MENKLGTLMPCDDKLRTTLHCDGKEKLRRKLAVLQREYLRTMQRLKRAERLDVRNHAGSSIPEQNLQDQSGPGVTSSPRLDPPSPPPFTQETLTSPTPALSQGEGHTGGPVEPGDSSRSPVIRLLLPSDVACPLTPDHGFGPAIGPRTSTALRLSRSRRSRLRLERKRRAAEAAKSTDNSEEGQEQSKMIEGETESEMTVEVEVVRESEELLSGSASESPSLLLTHWNTRGSGEVEAKERHGQEKGERETELRDEGNKECESASLLLTCRSPVVTTEGGGQEETQNGRGEEKGGGGGEEVKNIREGQRCGSLLEESSSEEIEQHSGGNIEKSSDRTMQITGEKNGGPEQIGGEHDRKASCTLVEGLLFPAEYYVRTTRRMTFSQSQPDMQAVIRSQLTGGRQRRGCQRRTNTHSDEHTLTDIPPLTTAPTSLGSSSPSHADTSARLTSNSQSHNETMSDQISANQANIDACLSSAASTAGPVRRRRGERGKRVSWRSLLLPSSPKTPLLPLPSLPAGPVVSGLVNFDIQQDFYLPDDQFASLKLLKLQQAVTAVEPFTCLSYNTRSSSSSRLHANAHYSGSSGDQMMPLPLPLTLTPPIASSPRPSEERLSTVQSIDPSPSHPLADNHFTDALTESSARQSPDRRGDQQPERLHAEYQSHANTKSLDQPTEQDAVNLCILSQSSTTANYVHKLVHHRVKQQPPINSPSQPADQFTSKTMESLVGRSNAHSSVRLEQQTSCPGETDQRCPDEDKPISKTLSYSERPPQEPSEDSSTCCVQTREHAGAPGERPTRHPDVKRPAERLTEDPPEPSTKLPADTLVEYPAKCPADPDFDSRLIPGPPSCPFLTSPPLLSALPSSPPLPSLGLTPHLLTASLSLTSSPSAPTLTLPPPHSPSTQFLSPPPLSPCLPLTPLPPASPSGQTEALSSQPATADRCQGVVPGTRPPVPSMQLQDSGGQVGRSTTRQGHGQVERTEEMAEGDMMSCTHTLKAPAGGCLVDACCLSGPGGLCVAAAGKWAVCVWDQTSTSDWSLIHTWTFDEPVISVFPVLDAVGLMCVTLGQLEIREVWMLSCSSLSQVLLCGGVLQVVEGVAKSRVVSSSHSATHSLGSALQMFTLSQDGSAPTSQPLASPGVCVGALAAVDGLSDALIGSAEDGSLFIWNLGTGQLLRRLALGEGLAHTACLRGYSSCGVLFVLLQHQLLSSLEEEERGARNKGEGMFSREEEEEEERRKTALFSLVATNPISGKSVLSTRLYPPTASSDRLCEADVHGSSVVGLSQRGCVYVWELLGVRGGSEVVWASESEGWQLARWGGRDTLLTGHYNGDLTLSRYTANTASLRRSASQ
ncbi:uncharacterized protein palb2 [Diretmus argenteus]